MKRPDEVRGLLAKRYASQHRLWLGAQGEPPWPLRIALGPPTEAEALRQPDAVRAWAESWRVRHGPGELEWVERRWRVLGTQRLPQVLVLADPAQAAVWAGEQERWQNAAVRSTLLTQRWPALRTILPRLFDILADYAEDDLQRLQDLLGWLMLFPASGLYPRQLPIPGLDSKWLEARIGTVAAMLAALRGTAAHGDPYVLCGLQRPPPMLRIRALDPALRAQIGGLGDLAAPADMLAQLTWQPARILIVENLQTGLALADLPGTVAVIGLGYAVEALARLPWARPAACCYWGDIDTHGYAILHQARSVLPGLRSIMMDDATLHQFRALWSTESAQSGAAELSTLTAEEHAVYHALRNQTWGQGVRLEQERIAWDYASTKLSEYFSS